MENTPARGLQGSSDYGDGAQWKDTILLLRLVQIDYEGARKQLENVSHTLSEREALISQRLQYAFLASGGYRTLCLVPYGAGTTWNQIGKTTLGKLTEPAALPQAMRLEARCLGRFELCCEYRRVDQWQSMKAKSVFQCLMTKPREPIVKDLLMETLWPDSDPQVASNNLKAAVHSLRRTLGSLFNKQDRFPYILFLQGNYQLNPDIDLWVDVEEFERHWTTGRYLGKEGKLTEAMREYELAESLYRGDYLEDEPYEEWTLLRREALKDTYLIILGKLADHSMEITDYEGSIIYCHRILVKDPCREDAYRRLMCCYSRLGQRSRALRWYEMCRRTIQTEVDAPPDVQTTALYHQLLRNEPI